MRYAVGDRVLAYIEGQTPWPAEVIGIGPRHAGMQYYRVWLDHNPYGPSRVFTRDEGALVPEGDPAPD